MDRQDANSGFRPGSNRFLQPENSASRPPGSRPWGPTELFAEGTWQEIRVTLEQQGWSHSQIERIHDQLRHGWPLSMARHNVATSTGHCPLRSGRQS